MRPRLVLRRLCLSSPRIHLPPRCHSPARLFSSQAPSTRPLIPFLSPPRSSQKAVRHFSQQRKGWLRHEAKIFVRFTFTFWGIVAAGFLINFAVTQEQLEREFPTPPEWGYSVRKVLRDAKQAARTGSVMWAQALRLARGAVLMLEDPALGRKQDSDGVTKLTAGPTSDDTETYSPDEFVPRNISAKSEEWRRGYFEALMLTAKAAEYVDGWVMDKKHDAVCAPEHVIGPSNPKPKPLPPGSLPAPREEDCELAFPPADRFYMKILATEGLSVRQKIEAAIEYALFMEFKGRTEGPESLYHYALAQATQGLDQSRLPFDSKTYVLKDTKAKVSPPSLNILDSITAIANHKARRGDVNSALPIYLSLLKARRSLNSEPARQPAHKKSSQSTFNRFVGLVSPPRYPPPPPDGTTPPWRSPGERCEEASINLYIGEILFATSSKEDGLAWTRDGVDVAEEQLRSMGGKKHRTDEVLRQPCRECLTTGLGNWATMVARLAREEAEKKAKNGAKTETGGLFGFWSGKNQAQEGRWEAEEAVIKERVRRTVELTEELRKPEFGIAALFKA